MEKRFAVVFGAVMALLVLSATAVFAQGPVTLPDWGSAIGSQTNAFLGWSAIAGPVQFIIGTAIGAIGIAMLVRVFHRGG